MGTDHCDAAADTAEMSGRPQGDDATASGAAIALHPEASWKTVEISGREAMSPYAIVLTTRTETGTFPRVSASAFKNRFDTDSNMPYHDSHVLFRGVYPEERRAESSAKTLRPFFICAKGTLNGIPNNLAL